MWYSFFPYVRATLYAVAIYVCPILLGNIGHRLHNAHSFYTYCGFNIFLVEYRGYGKSEGTASESGTQVLHNIPILHKICMYVHREGIVMTSL